MTNERLNQTQVERIAENLDAGKSQAGIAVDLGELRDHHIVVGGRIGANHAQGNRTNTIPIGVPETESAKRSTAAHEQRDREESQHPFQSLGPKPVTSETA